MARKFTSANSEAINYSRAPSRFPADYPFTLFCWAKTPNKTTQTIFGTHKTSGNSGLFQIEKSGGVGDTTRFTFQAVTITISGTDFIPLGTWNNAAAVARSATDRELYVNGVSNGTSATSVTFPDPNNVNIGREFKGSGASQYLDGSAAQCAIWDVALTVSEIQLLNIGVTPDKIRPNHLIFYTPVSNNAPLENKADSGNIGNFVGSPLPALDPPKIKSIIKRTLKRPWYTLLESTVTDIIVPIKRIFQRPTQFARRFNEVDQYGTMPDHPDLTLPDGDWTIAVKFKIPDNTGSSFQYLLSWGVVFASPSFNVLLLETSHPTSGDEDKLRVAIEDAGGDFFTNDISDSMTSSSSPGTRRDWQTWFFQRKGDTFTMYEENTDVGNDTNSAVGAIDPATQLNIARREDTPTNRWFGGDIEFVAKWDRAISEIERLAIISGQPANKFPAHLKYYVPFDEQPKGIDLTGNHHDVTWVANPKLTLAPPESRKQVVANRFFGFGETGLSSISNTITKLFHIDAEISNTSSHLFNIRNTVAQTSTKLFNILAEISQTSTKLFHINAEVSNTSTHLFDIASALSAVSNTITKLFHINAEVSQTSTHRFGILNTVSNTITKIFNIRNVVAQTSTHLFDIASALTAVSNTITKIFHVNAEVSNTSTHRFGIISDIILPTTRVTLHLAKKAANLFLSKKQHNLNLK